MTHSRSQYIAPHVGDSSPWGRIDHARTLAPGIVSVGTASHGGIHLRADLNAAIPESLRSSDAWYEEDCEWAHVALIYPHAFNAQEQASAHRTVMNYMPEAYEAWAGVVLGPGESRKKDEANFLATHPQDWLVNCAWGAWHESVPDGWVGVSAMPGSHYRSPVDQAPQAHFLIPFEEYENAPRSPGAPSFVCDPSRHPTWDPKKPKAEQILEISPALEVEDDDESLGMRP